MHTSSEPLSPIRSSRTSLKGQIVILKDYRYFIGNDHRLFCFSPTEHVCSIIMWLFRNLSGNLRTRLVQKFVENDHIKVDRLMELHFKYHSKIQECDTKIEKEKQVSIHNLSFEALPLTASQMSLVWARSRPLQYLSAETSHWWHNDSTFISTLHSVTGLLDTSRFDTNSAQAVVKLHKNFDHFKYSLRVNKKTFWVKIFRSLSQVRETIYKSTE